MKVSIFCPTHRYGGMDMLFLGLENQTFSKSDYELILVDKLYKHRHHLISDWAARNDINIIHLSPTNNSEYHVHSSILNQCLKAATGDCCIVMGDYTYTEPQWIERHYLHYLNGWCTTAPQVIYGLPKLKENLKQCISVFTEPFDIQTLKILPQYKMDVKLQLPHQMVDHRVCYNRNESFPRKKALEINGFDERYDNFVGPSNKEFYLRLIYDGKCKIVNDPNNYVHRIMSYPIPPFTNFKSSELDDSMMMKIYKELCKKYNAEE